MSVVTDEQVELVAKCGDILFYRNFFVHAGSRNVGGGRGLRVGTGGLFRFF